MASALSFLTALGSGISGYNQGADAADAAAARDAQIKMQAEQMARDNFLRQQQLAQQGTQFTQTLAEIKADRKARATQEANRLKFTGDENTGNRADALALGEPAFEQSLVGRSIPDQASAVEGINARRSAVGLPPIRVPGADSGNFTLQPGATVAPNAASTLFAPPGFPGADLQPGGDTAPPLVPTLDASSFRPVPNPGFSASPSTAAMQAGTAQTVAETNAIPGKLRAAETQQQFENRMALQAADLRAKGFTADQINNAEQRALQERLASMAQSGETSRLNSTQTFDATEAQKQRDAALGILRAKAGGVLTPTQKIGQAQIEQHQKNYFAIQQSLASTSAILNTPRDSNGNIRIPGGKVVTAAEIPALQTKAATLQARLQQEAGSAAQIRKQYNLPGLTPAPSAPPKKLITTGQVNKAVDPTTGKPFNYTIK